MALKRYAGDRLTGIMDDMPGNGGNPGTTFQATDTGQQFIWDGDDWISSTGVLVKATETYYGVVKLGSDTIQSVAKNSPTSTAGRTYPIQVNSSGQLVVNVGWTDTTYTKGSLAELNTGTNTTGKLQSAKDLHDWATSIRSNIKFTELDAADIIKQSGGGISTCEDAKIPTVCAVKTYVDNNIKQNPSDDTGFTANVIPYINSSKKWTEDVDFKINGGILNIPFNIQAGGNDLEVKSAYVRETEWVIDLMDDDSYVTYAPFDMTKLAVEDASLNVNFVTLKVNNLTYMAGLINKWDKIEVITDSGKNQMVILKVIRGAK